MAQCEAIVPEATVIAEDGTESIVPEHQCENDASLLSRSMEEQECNLGHTHWVKTDDHVYCGLHYIAGEMAHADGSKTQHAPMSIEDA